MSSSSDLVGRPDEAVRPLYFPTLRRKILAGLTPRQAEAASLNGPVLVLAGAGTGKTRTLTAGVAWRIDARGIDPDRILAVTFTNKAAKEMADRIRILLAGQRAPSWIGTFHGLGARASSGSSQRWQRCVRGFDILDADDSRRLVKRTLKAMNVSLDDTEGRDPLKRLCNPHREHERPAGDAGRGSGSCRGPGRQGPCFPGHHRPRRVAPRLARLPRVPASAPARRTRPTSATSFSGPPRPCNGDPCLSAVAGRSASTAC